MRAALFSIVGLLGLIAGVLLGSLLSEGSERYQMWVPSQTNNIVFRVDTHTGEVRKCRAQFGKTPNCDIVVRGVVD